MDYKLSIGRDFRTLPRREITFSCEQDGPPERQLKAELTELFARHETIERAYLVRGLSKGSGAVGVYLCIKSKNLRNHTIVRQTADVFGRIFSAEQSLDILFLTNEEEHRVRKVCSAFFETGR